MNFRQPRGFRNNNPLNIEYNEANDWVGQTGVESLGRFATFSHKKYGIRAGAKLISRYMGTYGLRTVNGIIGKWAPSHENDTNHYAATVAARMGVSPDETIYVDDINDLIYQMVKFECGEYLDYALIDEGCALAGIA